MRRLWLPLFSRMNVSRKVLVTVLLAPLLVVSAGSLPYLGFGIPAVTDAHDESYQPLKTLRYFHQRGEDVHKWGTLPNFIYAPAFAGMLAYWRLTEDFQSPSGDYPYGFTRPHEQIGAMIAAARTTVFLVGLVATLSLAAVLISITSLPLLSMAAFSAIFAASPGILHAFGSSKSDGLMIAFVALSMASYLWIVFNGLTARAGVVLSVFAAAAVSCKELAAPAFIIPYAALLLDGLLGTARRPDDRRAFVRAFAIAITAGVLAYAAINIVYSPSTWVARMDLVLFGSLKDPEVWGRRAGSGYGYDLLLSIVRALGYVGTLLVLAAAVGSILRPDRRVLLAWLPLLSFTAIVFATGTYMPTRFMIPTPALAVLPVAALLAVNAASLAALSAGRAVRRTALALLLVAVSVECVTGVAAAWADLRLNEGARIEGYVAANSPETAVYPANLHPRNPGSSRLSYLGYRVDDRALWQINDGETPPPELLFVSRLDLEFLADFREYPARAELWEQDVGFDYRDFPGLERVGYRLTGRLGPELGSLRIAAFQPYTLEKLAGSEILVYRLEGDSAHDIRP